MASLIELVLGNNLDGIRAELRRGADPNERDEDGRTPLIHAAIDDRIEIAKVLLDAGALVDARDESGNSALHYAAQEYHPQMASLLIGHGAKVDIEDQHRNTPLGRAVFNSRGRGELIRLLLAAGADQNHINKYGKSPIGLAKTIANYNIIQFFG